MITRCAFVLAISFFSQQPQQWPQVNPFLESARDEWQRAYRDFKPGPKVAADLKKLDDRAGDLRDQLVREEITLEHFSVELQRVIC